MKQTPLIPNKITLKEFKETSLMMKTDQGSAFVLLYGHSNELHGYKYRIVLEGTKQAEAYRAAYYLLFGNTDEYDKGYVTVATDRGLKIPLGVSLSNAYRSQLFDAEWFKTCMSYELKEIED